MCCMQSGVYDQNKRLPRPHIQAIYVYTYKYIVLLSDPQRTSGNGLIPFKCNSVCICVVVSQVARPPRSVRYYILHTPICILVARTIIIQSPALIFCFFFLYSLFSFFLFRSACLNCVAHFFFVFRVSYIYNIFFSCCCYKIKGNAIQLQCAFSRCPPLRSTKKTTVQPHG